MVKWYPGGYLLRARNYEHIFYHGQAGWLEKSHPVRVPLSERADPDPACVRVPAPSSSESAPPRAARHITHQPSSPHAAISADVGRPCRSPPPSPKMGKGGSPSKYVDMGVAVAIPCFVCYSEFNRTRPAVCAHSDIGVVAECVHACAALCCARRES